MKQEADVYLDIKEVSWLEKGSKKTDIKEADIYLGIERDQDVSWLEWVKGSEKTGIIIYMNGAEVMRYHIKNKDLERMIK